MLDLADECQVIMAPKPETTKSARRLMKGVHAA